MKKMGPLAVAALMLVACNNKKDSGTLSVTGDIKNVADQPVYLEELFLSQKNPEIIDSAQLKNGSFALSAPVAAEGLYRIRLGDNNNYFVFINDRAAIHLNADLKTVTLSNYAFNSSASTTLQHFFTDLNKKTRLLDSLNQGLQILKSMKAPDSIFSADSTKFAREIDNYTAYFSNFIDTTTSPVMAAFVLGKSRSIEPTKLQASANGLLKRFPGNTLVENIVGQFNAIIQQVQQQNEASANQHKIGEMAPEITMPDGQGKPFSLSSLRGKYVLIDFWASWCGPCREENPNVVAAFNKYKDRNFTILGVSLDDDKSKWLNAVMQDNLTWQHISDLKSPSEAVSLYGVQGIPYNVLVDPQGKIIATSLRGAALEQKLAEVLK